MIPEGNPSSEIVFESDKQLMRWVIATFKKIPGPRCKPIPWILSVDRWPIRQSSEDDNDNDNDNDTDTDNGNDNDSDSDSHNDSMTMTMTMTIHPIENWPYGLGAAPRQGGPSRSGGRACDVNNNKKM